MQLQTKNSLKSTNRASLVAKAGMLTAIAMIFSYIEAIIPFNFGIPGIKLGLPNLVILIALYEISLPYAFIISLVRILLSGLLFGNVFGTVYSLAGGILSLLVMAGLKKTGLFSMAGVSMAGGVAHNMGQLLVAAFVVSDLRMFIYFPVLMFSGLITGIIIGLTGLYLDSRLPKALFR